MDPLQFTPGFGLFRLFGFLFVVGGALVALRPREMTSRRLRSADGTVATVEPMGAQLLLARVLGVFFVVVGLGLALGVVPGVGFP